MADVQNLGERYDLPNLDWTAVVDRLAAGVSQGPGDGGPSRHTCWLTTIDADGAPHVTAVGALWVDGTWWFQCSETTRKARNLARDPRCAVSVATEEFDLVVEGTATVVRDPAVVADMASRYAAGGWPAQPDDTGTALTAEFNAPSAGPPPYLVHRMDITSATAVGTTADGGGATRWRF